MAINGLAHKQYERAETTRCKDAAPNGRFERQKNPKPKQTFTVIPFSHRREISLAGNVWTGTDWVCVAQHRESPCKQYPLSVCAYGGMRMSGGGGWWGSGTLYNCKHISVCVFSSVSHWCHVSSETQNSSNVPLWFNTINTQQHTHATNYRDVGAWIIKALSHLAHCAGILSLLCFILALEEELL